MIFRDLDPHPLPLRTVMIEAGEAGDRTAVVNEESGYLIIPTSKSVIVVSKAGMILSVTMIDMSVCLICLTEDGTCEIQLVIIRNVAATSELSGQLYLWLKDVVDSACSERRDIRV